MNRDTAKGNWKVLKGRVKEFWGELTHDELDQIDGNLDQLEGLIQKKYGRTKDVARREVNDFLSGLNDKVR